MATWAKDNMQAILKRMQAAIMGSEFAEPMLSVRRRCTIAEVNAGVTLLPAAGAGLKYQVHDMAMISVGGAAAAATTIDILGTRAAVSVKLLAVAVAALTQSALVRAGAANAVILADGASFTDLDANTALTVAKTGSAVTTATHIDVIVDYVLRRT